MATTSEIERITQAIAACWSETTCAPGQWNPELPAQGQCEVSSFVAWTHLGGELVLGEVFRHGEFQEHHYWNRLDGVDLDLTRKQFGDEHRIDEVMAMSPADVQAKRPDIHEELAARIELLESDVAQRLSSGR